MMQPSPDRSATTVSASAASSASEPDVRPRFRVIPLDCEITAYAPDGGDPLF